MCVIVTKDTNVQLIGDSDFSITSRDGSTLTCRAANSALRDAWVQAIADNIMRLRDAK
jgi:hypothetical protein